MTKVVSMKIYSYISPVLPELVCFPNLSSVSIVRFIVFSFFFIIGENFFNSSRPCHPCYPNVMKLFVVTFADAKSLFSEF
jgi:hypothetical protein